MLDAYEVQEFNEDIINNLENETEFIYNKNYKQETYFNQPLFYINYNFNNKNVVLYAYGYKPANYKYVDNLGNLYFFSNTPFSLFRCEPFNTKQFYKIMDIIYNNE